MNRATRRNGPGLVVVVLVMCLMVAGAETAWAPVGKSTEKVITVPVAALQRIENEWLVFLPKGQDTFEIRSVGRGRELGTEIEIVSGLKAGEQVVVEGAFLLKAEAEKARSEGSEHEH